MKGMMRMGMMRLMMKKGLVLGFDLAVFPFIIKTLKFLFCNHQTREDGLGLTLFLLQLELERENAFVEDLDLGQSRLSLFLRDVEFHRHPVSMEVCVLDEHLGTLLFCLKKTHSVRE